MMADVVDIESDLDLAFQLQMQEAMTESLVLQPHKPDESEIIDLQTLELLEKFEQERKDQEQCEAEMRIIQSDLKRRVFDQKFAREILQIPEENWLVYGDNVEKPFGEGSSSSQTPPNDEEPFRLYFKGLFSDESVGDDSEVVSIAAIGAAVCDPSGNLILNVQKAMMGDWKSDWAAEDLELKMEVKALIEGLTAALSLDIKKIDFYCDYYPLYQYIKMRWLVNQQNIATVIDQACLLQRKFESCRAFHVARKDVLFAFKLAREAIDSQIIRSAESSRAKNLKETCSICLEDTDAAQMFSVEGCLHRYCISCMRQHVEVKLLHGMAPRCPHEGCKTQLNFHNSGKFLTPKLVEMMTQHMKEASIHVTEKLYCPYPTCSALMSKSEVLESSNRIFIVGVDQSGLRKCIKCYGLFCINCKVPWHTNMSCHEYKILNPQPLAEDEMLKSLATKKFWRQCVKCNHMIELAEGCYHIYCRCGYEFCYTCGAEWRNKKATCSCPIWDERNILRDPLQPR